jgi:hypothetical protein
VIGNVEIDLDPIDHHGPAHFAGIKVCQHEQLTQTISSRFFESHDGSGQGTGNHEIDVSHNWSSAAKRSTHLDPLSCLFDPIGNKVGKNIKVLEIVP